MSKGRILVGLVVVAFAAGFGALVWIDSGQRAGIQPPEGVEEFEVEQGHTPEPVDYEQDPPAGGEHNPVWQNSAFYEGPIRNENAVHTMEHGAVWITYSPGLPQDQKDVLQELAEGQECLLASPYPSLPEDAPVVASAWGRTVAAGGRRRPQPRAVRRLLPQGPSDARARRRLHRRDQRDRVNEVLNCEDTSFCGCLEAVNFMRNFPLGSNFWIRWL